MSNPENSQENNKSVQIGLTAKLFRHCATWRSSLVWYKNPHVEGPVDKRVNPLGAVSIRKTVLPGMAIPMLKIRRPNGRLIFNMEIAIRR